MSASRSQMRALSLGCALCLAFAAPAEAQQGIPHIGFLSHCTSSFDEEGFKQGLRELGYVEGKTIDIAWRRFLTDAKQLRSAADELVRAKVAIIVTCSTPATRAALEATRTIPVIFAAAGDPVATGLAASLSSPGANATGVSIQGSDLAAKRLDLLRQLAPRARRVAFIATRSNSGSIPAMQALNAAAKTLHIKLETYNTRSAEALDSALRAIPWKSIDGALVGADLVTLARGEKIAEAIRKARLPAVFPWRQFHEYGALISYGPDSRQLMRRGAYYVDKILKGAKPADLPVEQISKVDLVIDLRVARETGIEVPPELLYRADEVIR